MKIHLLLIGLLLAVQCIVPAASSAQRAMQQMPLLREFCEDPKAFGLSIHAELGQPGERSLKGLAFLNELRANNADMPQILLHAFDNSDHVFDFLVLNNPELKDCVLRQKTMPGIGKKPNDVYVTPVLHMVCSNEPEKLILLLKAGANANGMCPRGQTPLMQAIADHKNELANILLENGADARITKNDGVSSLQVAVQVGNSDIIPALFRFGAEVNKQADGCGSALHVAASGDNKESISLLLAAGANVNAKRKDGVTPLLLAVQSGKFDNVKLLLEAGADKDRAPIDGCSALHLAAQKGYDSIVQLLLECGANYTDECLNDVIANSPLAAAIFQGHVDIIRRLLALRGIPFVSHAKTKANLGHFLGLSIYHEIKDVIALFEPYKSRFFDLHTQDSCGQFPIHYACARPDADLVSFFLSCGANMDVCNRYEESPLYVAAMENNISAVELLCSLGADTQAKNILKLTPLDIAQINGHKDVVEFLRQYKPPITAGASSAASSSRASSSAQGVPEQNAASRSVPKKQVGSSSAKGKRKKQRGRPVALDDAFTIINVHKEQNTNEIFALRQPEQHMTVVVYKGAPYKSPKTSNVCNMSEKTDNFHTFSARVNEYLNCGIYIDAKNSTRHADLLADLGINKLKGFAIILLGKIEHEHYDARYALADKGQITRGRTGAFVYLFDKSGRCYHRCFHENRESKQHHMF